jgi:hypothetical protein
VRRFDTPEALRAAAAEGDWSLGLDHTGLVQEFISAAGGFITRVEVLDGRFLYAIRVHAAAGQFDLCPADICQRVDGADLERAACPADAPKNAIRVEGYRPPLQIVAQVERVLRDASIEVGGVEYVTDARDGRTYFYDINALSNFVADSPRVVGFDAFDCLAEFLERRAGGTVAVRATG